MKYLYKYLEKGPDQFLVRLDIADETCEDLRHDTVTCYELGCYITASEAYWGIYNFPIQRKQPPVRMLAIHLEDEQVITFNDEGAAQNLLNARPPATTLPAFFGAMSLHPHMRHMLPRCISTLHVHTEQIVEKKTPTMNAWETILDASK